MPCFEPEVWKRIRKKTRFQFFNVFWDYPLEVPFSFHHFNKIFHLGRFKPQPIFISKWNETKNHFNRKKRIIYSTIECSKIIACHLSQLSSHQFFEQAVAKEENLRLCVSSHFTHWYFQKWKIKCVMANKNNPKSWISNSRWFI